MEMHGSDRRSGRTISLNALSLRVSLIFEKKLSGSIFFILYSHSFTVCFFLVHRDIIDYWGKNWINCQHPKDWRTWLNHSRRQVHLSNYQGPQAQHRIRRQRLRHLRPPQWLLLSQLTLWFQSAIAVRVVTCITTSTRTSKWRKWFRKCVNS